MRKEELSETIEEAIDEMSEAIRVGLRNLGTGNAATPMGAIEFLACEIKEGSIRVAESIATIGEALARIADVMEENARNTP